MYFKKIEMHGFKSFAEPVTVEFSRGITGIVGPNGSGKSNISDALRWVLGEQSPKMLRGGKMEEVIFAGTAGRKSRGMAEVTLVIDNSDGSLPIDYKEVAITRRMFRTGESEYHINGNQCRLRDIRRLIMDTGIGVDGYSVIGQGKISDIISNKTESRREIFEEAAGIVMYRTKKAESERKLASTTSNMERLQDIIGEIEGRIGGLKEDSEKASEYLGLRDRYRELEINIILKNIDDLEERTSVIREDLEETSGALEKVRKDREDIEKDIAASEERAAGLERIIEEARGSLMEATEELSSMRNRGRIDEERLSHIDEDLRRLGAEASELSEKQGSEEEKMKETASAIRRNREEYEKAMEELTARTGRYDETASRMAGALEKSERYRSDIFAVSTDMNNARGEIRSMELLEETLDKRKERLLSDKESGDAGRSEMNESLERAEAERDELAGRLSSIEERMEERKKELAGIEAGRKEASYDAEKTGILLSQLTERKKTIEEMEHNYEGYNYAVKHVMRSGIRGIHGVVAELIDVPEGFETAVETALGGSLQNIVTEDDESAKEAVRSLKANRAGRMTFLPLSSVRGRDSFERGPERERGFQGYGPDCIDYDRKYCGIVTYLLGRVVFVDDMDNAVAMSKRYPKYRYVTLEGEVINTGGSITGGRYRNRTADILGRKGEIAQLAKRIEKGSAMKADLEGRIKDLEKKASELASAGLEDERACHEAERLIIEKDHELRFARSHLSDLVTSGEMLERELASIEDEKKRSREMTSSLRQKIAEGEKSIREAEARAEELLAEYNSYKDESGSMSEGITEARIAAAGLEKEGDHLKEEMERLRASSSDAGRAASERRRKMEELSSERDRICRDDEDLSDELSALEKKKAETEERLRISIEEREAEGGRMKGLISKRDDVAQDVDRYQSRRYELDIKCTKNETQLDTYKGRLWEDFEVSYVQAMDFRSGTFVMSEAQKESRRIKNRLRELGDVNVGAIEEYEKVSERYEFLTGQRSDVQEAADKLSEIISDMDHTIKKRFAESFNRIVVNFEEKFRELFGGGHAELRLTDPSDPLTSQIDIIAQPPGKKLQNINLLSGGEKTLTAIALMFAVLKAKPAPFCILDEVEAALDDANIERFIQCLRKLEGIQFALVTHQKSTMEHADVLYGVTMPEKGVSKILSLDMSGDFNI